MIFYDEEVSAADQPEEQSSSSGSALTYDDIYNAVYNGYMDAYTDIKIQEAEQQEIEEETTSEVAQRVIVDNFPSYQNVRVNNFSDSGIASLTDAVSETQENNSDVMFFGTETDARLYTIEETVAPSSAEQQTLLYTLDTRNILLIFVLAWFVVYLLRMLLKTASKFMKGRKKE